MKLGNKLTSKINSMELSMSSQHFRHETRKITHKIIIKYNNTWQQIMSSCTAVFNMSHSCNVQCVLYNKSMV